MFTNSTYVKSIKLAFIVLFTCLSGLGYSQLSGTKTIPTDYPSIAAFVTALNSSGVGAGGVTLQVPSGYTETAPAGGYAITATGTAANPIVITALGAATMPVVTASGSLTAGALNDAIFKIIGGDYITISYLEMRENAANTTTTAASNNMTEFGVALFYATTTDGCKNITIGGNVINLGSTYQNAIGVYSNSTHTATAVTTSATATGTAGNNSGLQVLGNTISNVNMGIVVVGPTAAADFNDQVVIGSNAYPNIISFGLTATFSGYANVSGTVNGILVRNSTNISVAYNQLTSVGTVTSGNMNGINLPAFSSTPTGTFTQNISNNTFNLLSANATGTVTGINQPSGSASATSVCSINANTFIGFGHTVASPSGSLTMISTSSTHFTQNINGNAFNNLSTATTGNVTFISHSYSIPANGTKSVSSNSINTGFQKLAPGGSVIFMTTGASSPNSASGVYNNNNISGVTLTGVTPFTGIADTDGSSSGANKTFNNNSILLISTGAAAITGISVTYWGGTSSSITGNTLVNLVGQGAITGINLGSAFNGATNSVISLNTISGFSSSGTGGAVVGISTSNTSTGISVFKNNIYSLSSTAASSVNGITVSGASTYLVYGNTVCTLSSSNASGTVNGILFSAGTTISAYNNIIGDLTNTVANAANAINGINITAGTTFNLYYNTIRIVGTSSGALFGSSAVSVSTTPTVVLRNNLLINTGTPTGAGICTVYRRSSTTLTSYDNTSNNNNMVGTAIFTDGTNTDLTLAAFQTRVSPRDNFTLNVTPTFLSTSCGTSTYLHLDPSVVTGLESGAVNISGITVDFDANIRAGNAGYAGTGTNPDIGADEIETALPTCSTIDAGTISATSTSLCLSSPTTTMSTTGYTVASGVSFQWKVSNTPGGPYTPVIGGTGATSTTYTTPALVAGTYYFVLEATCSAGPIVDLSNELTVNVYANPTVGVTPTSASYCSPGGSAVAITASNAVTYAWSPAAGLSATTGATVNASPSSTTTYTITGTDSHGCTGTATTTITVGKAVISAVATATPAAVCSGGNSQLQGTGYVADLVSTYNYAAGTGTTLQDMTSALTVIASGVDDTPMGTPASIGFNFIYNGVSYNSYSVSPDGWILLGGATAVSQFGNAVTSTTNIPKIYPFWDDLATGTNGNVKVLVTGTAPNRIMVVQWFVTIPRNTSGAANSTFQAWLYEGTGKIEFRYGTMGTPSSGSISGGLTAAAANFQSLTFAGNTSSNATANDANATAPASGTIYTYTLPAAPTYSWSPATFLNNAAISNPMASGITSTTTYTVTASNGGCSNTNTVTVTAGSPLTSSAVSSAGNSICIGSSTTITGSGIGGGAPYTYSWTGPNGFTSTAASFTIASAVSTDAGTYTVIVTDNCGATSTSAVTLVVNALPVVSVTSSANVYCTPSYGVDLTATGANTYVWSPAATLNSSTGSMVTAAPTGPTTYTVVGTDANGCSASATKALLYAAAVNTFTPTATPATICSNGNSTLVASTTTAAFTYCTSTHSSGCFGDNMSLVVLGSINNNSQTC